jgi:hypothetical protein
MALVSTAQLHHVALLDCGTDVSHVIDPFQATAFDNVGWDALVLPVLPSTFMAEASSSRSHALPRMFTAEGLVDGSHAFMKSLSSHFLQRVVRPGGLIVLDDAEWPSVATALRYFDLNLAWQPLVMAGRLTARRVPEVPFEPDFSEFKSF